MKRLLVVLILAVAGLSVGCGGSNENDKKPQLEDLDQSIESQIEETETIEQNNSSNYVSDNDVLPHDHSLRLSDTKEIIESKETLTESPYGIEGLWNSSKTWHVENSDFEIAYSFDNDGNIQYVSYMLIDFSLSDIELGFTEVTARKELDNIYGTGDGEWIINSNERQYTVTLKKSEEDNSIQLTIMINP